MNIFGNNAKHQKMVQRGGGRKHMCHGCEKIDWPRWFTTRKWRITNAKSHKEAEDTPTKPMQALDGLRSQEKRKPLC